MISFFLKAFYPSLVWNIPSQEAILYLTFDDGPHPAITPYVLNLLKRYDGKATFFCIGENIKKYPDVFQRIITEGHTVANHTYNHLNGWKTETVDYVKNVEACASMITLDNSIKPLFRPPYGRIKSSQIRKLKNKYRIIMWDVLSNDWNPLLTAEQCFKRVKRKSKAGSIIVFHDSAKAEARMKPALKDTLELFSGKGYSFKAIPSA